MKETLKIIAEEFNYLNEEKRKIESKPIKTQEDIENLAAIQQLYQHMQEKINNWADEKNNEVSKDNVVENNSENDNLRERFEAGKEAIQQIKNQSKALQPKIEGAAKSQKDAILERAGFVETNTVDDRKIRIHPSLVGQYHDLVKEQKELTKQLNDQYYQERDKNKSSTNKDESISIDQNASEQVTEEVNIEKDFSDKINALDTSINQVQDKIDNMLEEKGRKKSVKYKGQQYYIPERYDGKFQYYLHQLEKLNSEKNELIQQNNHESAIPNMTMASNTMVGSNEAEEIIRQEIEPVQGLSSENEKTQLSSIEEIIKTNSDENNYVQNVVDTLLKPAGDLEENKNEDNYVQSVVDSLLKPAGDLEENKNEDNYVQSVVDSLLKPAGDLEENKNEDNQKEPINNNWNNIMSNVEKVPADIRANYFENHNRKVVPAPIKYEGINDIEKTQDTDLGISEELLDELLRDLKKSDKIEKELEESLRKSEQSFYNLPSSSEEALSNSTNENNIEAVENEEKNEAVVEKETSKEKETVNDKQKIKIPDVFSRLKEAIAAKTKKSTVNPDDSLEQENKKGKEKIKGFITKVRKPFKNMNKEIKNKIKVVSVVVGLIATLITAKSCNDKKYEQELEAKAPIESVSTDDEKTDLEKQIDKELDKTEEEKATIISENENDTSSLDTIEKQAQTEETSYVNTIKLTEDAKIYKDEFSAYLDEKNEVGQNLYYGTETEKIYLGGLYEDVDGNWQYLYISNPMAKQIGDEIVKNGGKVLSILVAEPSEFYKVYDGKTPLTINQINSVASGFIREDGINNENVKTGGMHI